MVTGVASPGSTEAVQLNRRWEAPLTGAPSSAVTLAPTVDPPFALFPGRGTHTPGCAAY